MAKQSQSQKKRPKKAKEREHASGDRSGWMTTAVVSLVTNGGRRNGHDNHDNGNGDDKIIAKPRRPETTYQVAGAASKKLPKGSPNATHTMRNPKMGPNKLCSEEPGEARSTRIYT